MSFFYIVSYILLVCFFLLELARREKGSGTLKRTKSDKGSSTIIWVLLVITIILITNSTKITYGKISGGLELALGAAGAALGAVGLTVRYIAFKTLGRFFTRILRETENHTLVTSGIYRYIRHPGYLGNLLIFMGAALCAGNLIPIIFVPLAFTPVYLYRIHAEETMLLGIFGDEYTVYKKCSKRLIPFIF